LGSSGAGCFEVLEVIEVFSFFLVWEDWFKVHKEIQDRGPQERIGKEVGVNTSGPNEENGEKDGLTGVCEEFLDSNRTDGKYHNGPLRRNPLRTKRNRDLEALEGVIFRSESCRQVSSLSVGAGVVTDQMTLSG
jgi:hypothetical protein